MSVRSIGLLALALACVLTALPSTAAAGPWTRAPGSWYAKLSQGLFVAEGYRDATGRFVDDATYEGHTTALYAELGLVERLQTQLYLPYVVATNRFDPGPVGYLCEGGTVDATRRASTGDAQLGLQLDPGLLPIPHALRLQSKLPLYDVTAPRGQCSALFPQQGDGQLDLALWLSVGGSLLEGRAFAYLEVGHVERTDVYFAGDSGRDYAATLALAAQGGYAFMDDGYAMLSVRLDLPHADDGRTRGALWLGPQVIVPLGSGLAAEADVSFTPWARNGSLGRAEHLYWTAVTFGVSHKH